MNTERSRSSKDSLWVVWESSKDFNRVIKIQGHLTGNTGWRMWEGEKTPVTEAIWNPETTNSETAGVGGQVGGLDFTLWARWSLEVQKRYPREEAFRDKKKEKRGK